MGNSNTSTNNYLGQRRNGWASMSPNVNSNSSTNMVYEDKDMINNHRHCVKRRPSKIDFNKDERIKKCPRTTAMALEPSNYKQNNRNNQKAVARILSDIINRHIQINKQKLEDSEIDLPCGGDGDNNCYNDVFCGLSIPSISLQDYFERIIRYLSSIVQYETETGNDNNIQPDLALRYLIISLMLIERVAQTPNFFVCMRNIHRLIITGVTIASKLLDDSQPTNSYFAKLGGITLKELNHFEVVFCMTIRFNLTIQVEEFERYYSSILQVLTASEFFHIQKEMSIDEEKIDDDSSISASSVAAAAA